MEKATWKTSEAAKKFVEDKSFVIKKFNADVIVLCNMIRESEDIQDLLSIPEIKGDAQTFWLATILQNMHHFRNNIRTDAIKEGKFIDFTSDEDGKTAEAYVKDLLKTLVFSRLRKAEGDLEEKYRAKAQDQISE